MARKLQKFLSPTHNKFFVRLIKIMPYSKDQRSERTTYDSPWSKWNKKGKTRLKISRYNTLITYLFWQNRSEHISIKSDQKSQAVSNTIQEQLLKNYQWPIFCSQGTSNFVNYKDLSGTILATYHHNLSNLPSSTLGQQGTGQDCLRIVFNNAPKTKTNSIKERISSLDYHRNQCLRNNQNAKTN